MTEEEVNKINEQYRKDQIPDTSGDHSQANNSRITHPDEDTKRSAVEGIIAELGNHTVEIDGIKASINILSQQQTQIAEMLNQQTQAINNLAGGNVPQGSVQGQPAQGLNMESIAALGDVAEKLVGVYKNLKGSPPAAPSFIDPNYINDQVKASVMGNFEIGNALINNLKSKLVNKAVTASVTEALKDTNDTHAPQ